MREEPAALRKRAASCPPRDRGGSSGALLSKKRGWDRQAGRPPGSLPRGWSRGGSGGPAYLLFSSSWVSSGWVFCASRATSPRQSRLGGSGFLTYKVSSGRRLRPGTETPRGGRGAGEGREGRRRRSRCPRRPGRRFTSGSPPPQPGGVCPAWSPGSCTPRRDATAPGGWPRRRRGGGPGRLRSAPPPLPAPACVAAAGTPALHLGGPSPRAPGPTEAPAPPQRSLPAEQPTSPGPR